MTTLNEEELRKAFVDAFQRWGLDKEDGRFELDSSGAFLNVVTQAGYLGFKVAFMPDVLQSLGIVICDSKPIAWVDERSSNRNYVKHDLAWIDDDVNNLPVNTNLYAIKEPK